MHIVYNKKKKVSTKGISFIAWAFMLGGFALIGAWAMPNEKIYPVSLTKDQWIKYNRYVDVAKYMMAQSSIPAKDVTAISDSLSLFQNELGKQLNPIFLKEDSVNKKPKQ